MDKVLVEIKNADGESIYVETNVGTLDKNFISSGKSLQTATTTFEESMRPIVALANDVSKKLGEILVKPDTIELEFGIKFSGNVNVWVISGTAEGNINLKLTWESGKKEKE